MKPEIQEYLTINAGDPITYASITEPGGVGLRPIEPADRDFFRQHGVPADGGEYLHVFQVGDPDSDDPINYDYALVDRAKALEIADEYALADYMPGHYAMLFGNNVEITFEFLNDGGGEQDAIAAAVNATGARIIKTYGPNDNRDGDGSDAHYVIAFPNESSLRAFIIASYPDYGGDDADQLDDVLAETIKNLQYGAGTP